MTRAAFVSDCSQLQSERSSLAEELHNRSRHTPQLRLGTSFRELLARARWPVLAQSQSK
jgi:hypothetical protein